MALLSENMVKKVDAYIAVLAAITFDQIIMLLVEKMGMNKEDMVKRHRNVE